MKIIRVLIGSILLFLGLPMLAAGLPGIPMAAGLTIVGLFVIFK